MRKIYKKRRTEGTKYARFRMKDSENEKRRKLASDLFEYKKIKPRFAIRLLNNNTKFLHFLIQYI